MKVKTSVSLSKDLLDQLDKEIGEDGNRSEYMEMALRERLRSVRRARRGAHDAAIYAKLASDRVFQREAQETLEFQPPWWELGEDVELADEVQARIDADERLRATG